MKTSAMRRAPGCFCGQAEMLARPVIEAPVRGGKMMNARLTFLRDRTRAEREALTTIRLCSQVRSTLLRKADFEIVRAGRTSHRAGRAQDTPLTDRTSPLSGGIAKFRHAAR